MKLLLATSNAAKTREIEPLLAGLPIALVKLAECPGIAAPEEIGRTFFENARSKALYYAETTGLASVAEDSGLEIDALDGAPGVHSARFGGESSSYPRKFALLYELLRSVPASERQARFVCALALADAKRILFEATGTVEGMIAPEPRG